MKHHHPDLLEDLAMKGQAPELAVISCSDSRASPETFTLALPGTMFTDRNIANQFPRRRENEATTVVTYALEELSVKHLIILGHYGCGGVAAAIASPPTDPTVGEARIQAWIQPIRDIWERSEVPEIVAARAEYGNRTDIPEPGIENLAFRRLVEENVKKQVAHAAHDAVVREHWQSGETNETALWVHGMVYDIRTGVLSDLHVSRGPGSDEKPSPPPAALVQQAAASLEFIALSD
ncbi:carbonic anhydrase [Mrakia frigida]|uniref:carbonic anhydrase n=1 Tax=Mrakia frigida TaxID=29902 RepID=UPI003FCC0DC0